MAATAESVPSVRGAPGTIRQCLPSQCSISGWPGEVLGVAPTAQTSVLEMAVTPDSVPHGRGMCGCSVLHCGTGAALGHGGASARKPCLACGGTPPDTVLRRTARMQSTEWPV